ncbi:Exportin-2 [Zancudomyces culisetae]|uniref:Exportin-2 n=1 Tax=Zancudomyces culisetae TaxID=1213189 RepID=A0A1R1PM99_ZANCU|nr:Exportin-2 [Zancudomyces culisetae]OMH82063.1 Exportin-2 [Zancudomyces culisetae]|eukprot:OMH79829.1 Exportin-2 [Zancudomyces culisetae]
MVKNPRYREKFSGEEAIKMIVEKIVIRNMELSVEDEEQFEDSGVEYVKKEVEGYETESRRKSASELVRSLLEQHAVETTKAMSQYVVQCLEMYSKDPVNNWRAKDAAQFMVTSLSVVASVQKLGVTVTNNLVDINEFYSKYMEMHLNDIGSDTNSLILKTDAIKFVYVFRNQLNVDKIVAATPKLIQHLGHPNVAVSTFAAVALERLLVLKRDNRVVIDGQSVGGDYGGAITDLVFNQLEKSPSAEKMAENEFYMKLIMRTTVTTFINDRAKISSQPSLVVMAKLCMVVDLVSKNPSNPKFNHYLFETISLLLSRISPATCADIEALLFPRFEYILQNQVAEFMPYVFQLLSVLVRAKTALNEATDRTYLSLLQPLLQPALWESSGNVPALTELLQSYLSVGASLLVSGGMMPAILGIFQKLLSTKQSELYAFDLLTAIVCFVDISVLSPYLKAVFTLILSRLQQQQQQASSSSSSSSHPTPSRLLRNFVLFIAVFSSINAHSLVDLFNSIQPNLLSNLVSNLIAPNIPSALIASTNKQNDCKLLVHGYLSLLACPPFFSSLSQSGNSALVVALISSLVNLLQDPVLIVKNTSSSSTATGTGAATSTATSTSDSSYPSLDDDSSDLSATVFQASFVKLSSIRVYRPSDHIITRNSLLNSTDQNLLFASDLKSLISNSPISDGNAFMNSCLSQLPQDISHLVNTYLLLLP